MRNKTLLRKQKAKFLLYNLLAFFIIFFVLGVVAIKTIEGYFYSDADRELYASKELLLAVNTPGRPDVLVLPLIKNPRINYLLYYENGELIGHDLPDFLDSEKLDSPAGSEKIYDRKIGEFNYRVLEFSFEVRQTVFLAQIIINIDGEIALRNNIITIYLICLSVIIVLTALASFVMSSVTMLPIVKSMEKQSEFVSDASHELRTPLTVLQSRLEQLLSNPGERIIDRSEEISDCLSEVVRMTKLSNNLLTLAKSDADKILPEITEFDVFELITKVGAPYGEMANCENKVFKINGESILIRADNKKIMQVLIILLDNALKFTKPSDTISVDVRRLKTKCEIIVSDTGTGVSEQGLKRIFERFYRDDASRGVTEGSGLGLAIAKQIVEEHNGSIFAEHNEPKGLKIVLII